MDDKIQKTFPKWLFARQHSGNQKDAERGIALVTSISLEEVVESEELYSYVAQYQLVGVRKYKMNAIEVK